MANFSELQQTLLKAGWKNVEELKIVLNTLTDSTESKTDQLKEILQSLIDNYFIYLGQLESLNSSTNSISTAKLDQSKIENISSYPSVKITEETSKRSLSSHMKNYQKQTTMNKEVNLKENYNNQANTSEFNVEFFKLDEDNKASPITPGYTTVDTNLDQPTTSSNNQVPTGTATDPLVMQDWPEPIYDAEEDAGMQEAMAALKNGALSVGAEIDTTPATAAVNSSATPGKELNEAEQYMQSLLNSTVGNPNIDSDMAAWKAK